MCGIAGQISLSNDPIPSLDSGLAAMSRLIAHRGPDGQGQWQSTDRRVGLVHRRLAIIDLSAAATQPMQASNGTILTYNGEIYNYLELRDAMRSNWQFQTASDTECILAAYERYGVACVNHLRGMFAFALWDEKHQRLFCARDRFGIKPFYYAVAKGVLYFASEVKALLPFLQEIVTSRAALAEYLTFQYTIGDKTLFKGVHQLLPGHAMCIENGKVFVWRYWDVRYEIDFDHSPRYFYRRLRELLEESIGLHVRSDVPVGCYLSGGIDSTLVYSLARTNFSISPLAFHGRFVEYPDYDESAFAFLAAENVGGQLCCADIRHEDFHDHIQRVIYYLDFPVAGPGSFPQYMVSRLASEHVKVVLGGQGGDEIFGGYARYLVAYFEQCIKAAIDGSYKNGNYVVTIESIVPNLGLLREYKPLMKEFWREGLFAPMDERYFRLVNRSSDMQEEIDWDALDQKQVFEDFLAIFDNRANVAKESYFDKMTHFDFKCLLPALLHVEDRMSMAHGLESRVPLLDHPLVEFAATVPADVKFKGGNMKHLIKQVFSSHLPLKILQRRDKMGFPVPLKEWFERDLRDFVIDICHRMAAKNRPYINSSAVIRNLGTEARFSRKIWALLSLELWYEAFHDRAYEWQRQAHKQCREESVLLITESDQLTNEGFENK
jgi:asparagine synthase (glutamine-hydrolysing)